MIKNARRGGIYQINDHLWEGIFFPRLPGGKRKKFNTYAQTRDQCEAKLAEMIAEKESGDRGRKSKTKRGRRLRRPQQLVCSKQRKGITLEKFLSV